MVIKKNLIIILFFVITLFIIGCNKKKKEQRSYYTLKGAELNMDVYARINEYIASEYTTYDAGKYIVLCKYTNYENKNYVMIGQYNLNVYFFYDHGFSKNVYYVEHDSILVILEIDKSYTKKRSLDIDFNNKLHPLKFNGSSGLYFFLTPDSIIPQVVKDNVDSSLIGGVVTAHDLTKWMYFVDEKGIPLDTLPIVNDYGLPIRDEKNHSH